MTTCEILIIYRTGEQKKLDGVSEYGIFEDSKCFYFEKNGYRSFIPKEVVSFFGRSFDYES